MAGPAWKQEEHNLLVQYAPRGAQAIYNALIKAGFRRSVNAIQSYATKFKIKMGMVSVNDKYLLEKISPEQLRLLMHMSKSADRISLRDLADRLDMAPGKVETLVEKMTKEGFRIEISPEGEITRRRQPLGTISRHEHTFKGKTYRFGLISDTHICSTYADLESLSQAYEIFKEQEIKAVYHAGNIAEGQDCFPGQNNYLTCWGAHNQASEVATALPKIEGITTYFLGSSTCHEGHFYKTDGLEFGALVGKKRGVDNGETGLREDLVYLGLDEADIVLSGSKGQAIMRLQHPGGGTAYAISYRPQKIVESLSGGEKPDILVLGHFHKMLYSAIRNIHVFLAGTLQFQTPFMFKHAIEAHRGFWIIEATVEADGSVTRLKQEAFRFYKGRAA